MKRTQRGDKTEFDGLVKKAIKKCNLVKDFDERLACKADLVYRISMAQDDANLNVMGDCRESDPNCSLDSRWRSVHLLDNANAIFLGVSAARYDPDIYLKEAGHYVEEKMDRMLTNWRGIQFDVDPNPRNLYPSGRRPYKRTEAERAKAKKEFSSRL